MSIKKRITDAALFGFGSAAGKALFEQAYRELFGDEEDEAKLAPEEEQRRAKAAAKEAERRQKEEEKQRAKEAEARKKAQARFDREVDADLAALKKKLKG